MNLHRLHPFDVNWHTANDYRSKRPLFNKMDNIRGVGELTAYANGEVKEAIEELEVTDGKPDSQKVADELNDVFNMMVAVTVMKLGKDFKPSDHLHNVNGDGKHSNAFERLQGSIADSEYDNAAIIETYQLLWSIGLHAFDRDTNAMTTQIIKTYLKVSRNYPVDLYNGMDPMTGFPLKREEDEVQVFTHLTKGLKTVRAHVKRTLKPSDVEPVRQHLANWVNSDVAIADLKQSLPENDVIRDSGIIIPSKETTILITEKHGILFGNSTSKDSKEV